MALKREDINDSICLDQGNLRQCCISYSKDINDTLLKKFNNSKYKDGSDNYLSIGGAKRNLIFKREKDSIFASIFFLSFKDAMQKLVVENINSNTLYLKMELFRDGIDDKFWIHKLNFSYKDSMNIIKKVILLY